MARTFNIGSESSGTIRGCAYLRCRNNSFQDCSILGSSFEATQRRVW
jgi:hypothetical protein